MVDFSGSDGPGCVEIRRVPWWPSASFGRAHDRVCRAAFPKARSPPGVGADVGVSASQSRGKASFKRPDPTTAMKDAAVPWPEPDGLPTLTDWDIVASHLGVMLAFEWDRPDRARDPALLTHHDSEPWITISDACGEPLFLLRQESAESFAAALAMLRAARVIIVADCVAGGTDTLRIREVGKDGDLALG